MKRWKRFLDRILALAASPGFENLSPAEQDRLYEQVARVARTERLLDKSRPPHQLSKWARSAVAPLRTKNRPSGGIS
jgi:hypothetical protein